MSESDLWRFYIDTVVDVWLDDGRELSIVQTPDGGGDEWPFDVEQVWIITACNPRSVPLRDEENANRHQKMGEQIAELGYRSLETVGFDPKDRSWSEQGYALLGISEDEVISLARSWDQNAVYKWAPDHWEVIGVLMDGRTRSGWRYLTGSL
jgi:hypothetical protein